MFVCIQRLIMCVCVCVRVCVFGCAYVFVCARSLDEQQPQVFPIFCCGIKKRGISMLSV